MNIKSRIKGVFKEENNKNIIQNILITFGVKGGGFIISLLTIPAYMRFFGNQSILGLWFTILSVMSWIFYFDIGIGQGLRNRLVVAIADNDRLSVKKFISSSYILIGIIVIFIMIVGLIVFPFVSWNGVFNISNVTISEKTLLLSVCLIFFAILLQFWLNIIKSILFALQKSGMTSITFLVTNILLLLVALIAPNNGAEQNLILLSMTYIFCANLPLIVITIIIFKKYLSDCLPKFKMFDKVHARAIIGLGGMFFFAQVLYMIITTTNEIFITQFTKIDYVVDYQIYNRLFTLVGVIFALSLSPIWSAITKAICEKKFEWLKKLYRLLNLLTLLGFALEFLLIPFLQIIVNVWLGENAIKINYTYALIFATFGGVFIYQTVLSTFVCGMGRLKLQIICYSIAIILKFVIIYFGVAIFKSWIVVVASNIIILLPYCILQPIQLRKLLASGEKLNNFELR